MTWINFRRILKTGFFNFWRNGFVSLSSVVVMVATLSVIGGLIFVSAILDASLTEIRSKVDINVYFVTTAPESSIEDLKATLETLPEVESVGYVSREEALENFRARHENDQITLQALEELGDNPLGASLNIKAKEPSQYEGIARFLEEQGNASTDRSAVIDRINYFQNKIAIDRLTEIIDSADRLGAAITIALALVSVLITFNTIRLAIFMSREEIAVMRLVGATARYIRGPFVVAGVLYGVVAALLTLAVFFPLTYWLGSATENFFIGLNVFNYYLSNLGQITLILLGSGAIIGAMSSYLAVRKYLKL